MFEFWEMMDKQYQEKLILSSTNSELSNGWIPSFHESQFTGYLFRVTVNLNKKIPNFISIYTKIYNKIAFIFDSRKKRTIVMIKAIKP